ncbi:MAG: mechanosensitive ion channel family protein [archaeon]
MVLSEFFRLEDYIGNEYVRALAVFVFLLFILRVVLSVVMRVVLKLTSKTKTDIDDILIARSSKPLTVIAFFVGLRIALAELTFSDALVLNISRSIYSVIVIAVAYLVYALIDIVLVRALKKAAARTKSQMDDTLSNLINGVLKFAIIVLALLYVLDLWGIEVVPVLGALGIAGLAVALALQPVLSNIFSGVAMILDKSVRANDLVYLDAQTKGKVESVGLRSTRIRTFDNELIIVPNSKLAESTIQNVALPEPKSRAVIPFGVAYGSDIEKVKEVVLKELRSLKHVEKEPEPSVRFIEMADSSLNFKAYFFVDSFENRFASIDEANTKIYNALNKAKISIPFPQMDVHVKK